MKNVLSLCLACPIKFGPDLWNSRKKDFLTMFIDVQWSHDFVSILYWSDVETSYHIANGGALNLIPNFKNTGRRIFWRLIVRLYVFCYFVHGSHRI